MAYLERPSVESRIYYQDRGEGVPIVLLNGLSQSTANWTSHASSLAADARVITWDARGQGRSTLGSLPLSLCSHGDDLEALLDHLEIERAVLVGFSHGARVALSFAADRPERTSALVLTSIGSDASAYRNVILRCWRETLRLGGVEGLAWVSMTHILGAEFLALHAEDLDVMARTVVQRNSAQGLAAMLSGLESYPPSLDEAARVRCPSLLITSTSDPLVSPAAARQLAEALRPLAHHVHEGCGHTIPVEAPAAWRAQLDAFLSTAAVAEVIRG